MPSVVDCSGIDSGVWQWGLAVGSDCEFVIVLKRGLSMYVESLSRLTLHQNNRFRSKTEIKCFVILSVNEIDVVNIRIKMELPVWIRSAIVWFHGLSGSSVSCAGNMRNR